ncbi:thiamine phosphate synthase [Candidatus Poribacteria bacterium]|nr:thiamine phosphate synthase [Candidatus Poribacteria bacterium]
MKRSVPRLHVLTDTTIQTRYTHAELARLAADAGADGVQFREKLLPIRDALREAEAARRVCEDAQVTFVVNDRLDIALAVDADGLHVGADDLPARVARRLLGWKRLLGVSAHTQAMAIRAATDGADYVGFGPVFGTQTKDTGREPFGVEGVAAFAVVSPVPVIAIGGVRASDAEAIIRAGAWGVAVISAVCADPDPRRAAADFVRAIRAALS